MIELIRFFRAGDLMSEIIGFDFIEINSALFSAQSRPRYYWTNINYSELPGNLNKEVIEDILEDNVSSKYYLKKDGLSEFIHENINDNKQSGKSGIMKILDIPKSIINDNQRQRRLYSIKGKSPTILARSDTPKILTLKDSQVRKLTPLECERLQKIPDNYTGLQSDTQRYKMIGNGFNIDTVIHILKGVKNKSTLKSKKLQNIQKHKPVKLFSEIGGFRLAFHTIFQPFIK